MDRTVSYCGFCGNEVGRDSDCTCAAKQKEAARIRQFASGATRDTDVGKPDYDGYLSPLVLHRYGVYMLKHSIQADGTLRASDNWQKGIPLTAYCKSLWRHFMDVWTIHRYRLTREITSYGEQDQLEEALCAVIFNASGYLHEVLKKPLLLAPAEAVSEMPPYPDTVTTAWPDLYDNAEYRPDNLPPPPPTYGWDE